MSYSVPNSASKPGALPTQLKGRFSREQAAHSCSSSNVVIDLTADSDNDTHAVTGNSRKIGNSSNNNGTKDKRLGIADHEAASQDLQRHLQAHQNSDRCNIQPSKNPSIQPSNISNAGRSTQSTRSPINSARASQTVRWKAKFDPDDDVWRCPNCSREILDQEDWLDDECSENAPKACENCGLQDGDEYTRR